MDCDRIEITITDKGLSKMLTELVKCLIGVGSWFDLGVQESAVQESGCSP